MSQPNRLLPRSYREAARAVVALEFGWPVQFARVVPSPVCKIDEGPVARLVREGHGDPDDPEHRAALDRVIALTLVGEAAETKYTGRPAPTEEGTQLAKQYLGAWFDDPATVDRYLRGAGKWVATLLGRLWPQVQSVALALASRGWLSGPEVEQLRKGDIHVFRGRKT